MEFKKATKQQAKARIALHGVSGGGKTYSALAIATNMGGKVALIDTERGSASKYADEFTFDVLEVADNYHPERAMEALTLAAKLGYEVVIIDSMTHFWNGNGGFLELVDREVAAMKSRGHKPDSFAAWKNVTPVYNHLIHAITSAPLHVFVTMRAKMEYVKEGKEGGGTTVRKVGLAPEMRDNFPYEFDVEGMLNIEHELVIGKTRCKTLDGKIFKKPGKDVADLLKAWLSDGTPYVAPKAPEVVAPPVANNTQEQLAETLERIRKAASALDAVADRPGYDAVIQGIAKSPAFIKNSPTVIEAMQRAEGRLAQ